MATSTAQRAGIWIIAAVLAIGTLAGFVAMILAPQNEKSDSKRLQDVYAKYQKDASATQKKQADQEAAITAEAGSLSSEYFEQFNGNSSKVGTFNKDDAQKKLVTEDIVVGTGDEITTNSTYAAYYLGWLPDGTIFDGSIDGGKLKAPLIVRPGGVITGWTEGVKGMKIGGIRQLTIPSEQAYGASSQGKITANTPLRFIVMPVKSLETIKQPEVPKELLQSNG